MSNVIGDLSTVAPQARRWMRAFARSCIGKKGNTKRSGGSLSSAAEMVLIERNVLQLYDRTPLEFLQHIRNADDIAILIKAKRARGTLIRRHRRKNVARSRRGFTFCESLEQNAGCIIGMRRIDETELGFAVGSNKFLTEW